MFHNKYSFIKHGLIAGIAMLLVMVIVSYGFMFLFPQVSEEYSTELFREWSEPLSYLFYLHPIILGLIMSWVWGLVSITMKGNEITKAVNFTLVFFLIAQIPGMFISYTTMNISLLMLMSWMLPNFTQIFAGSLILSHMNKKKVSIF